MENRLSIELPSELLPFQANIESTIQPYMQIKARIEDDLRLWQSKFGGLPYLPQDVPYPLDSNGQPLFLLAQINFTETPRLETLPETGILQFYVSGTDGIFGTSYEDLTKQANFRILYFPNVLEDEGKLRGDFGFLPKFRMLPLGKSCSLEFSPASAPMSAHDYHFGSTILETDLPVWDKEVAHLYHTYEKLFRSAGHKLRGYPYFTQDDPRPREDDYVLLFQMDSDGEADILWSDCGVGNFFILEDDLRARNFSRVLYSWDSC